MLKEIVLPPIDMKKFSDQPIDSNLIIMSHDFNVNELVIPFYETNVFDTYEAFYSFQGNTSIIIQEVYKQNNEIRIPIVNDVRRHKGIFTIELNASSDSTQATLLKLNVMVKRSNIDSNSEFLFNHYYKLFEDYEKEIAELNNATQSTIKTQLKQSQDNLQKVSKTLIAINDKVMIVNDTADGFMTDVTSKYNAFDTSVTQATQEITEQVDTTIANINAKNTQVNTLASDFEVDVTSKYNTFDASVTQATQEITDQVDTTIANIDAKNTQVNTLASDFEADVATKQSDVTSKYDAFDTSVTTAGQTIDDILGLAVDVQEVSAQVEEKVQNFKLKNEVVNGDFSQGTTGWIGDNVQLTEVGGKIRVTTTGSAPSVYQDCFILNKKYYIRFKYKSNATPIALPRVLNGGTVIGYIGNLLTEYTWSSLTANTSATSLYIRTYVPTGDYAEIDNVIAINLTDIFGAGNEPTKEEMDRLVEMVPNQWWDGELDLTQQQYVNWLLSFIREKANKTQEEWITPTLLNGWTSPNLVGYRKDQFGVVRLRGKILGGTAGQPAFNLPIGYRPVQNFSFSVASQGAGLAYGYISSSGDVRVQNTSNEVNLDLISFSTN